MPNNLNRAVMCEQSFTVIGISDSRRQHFAPEVLEAIASGRVFSGGRRHHEIVADLLPADAEWIDITVPLADVFRRYEGHPHVVVFASGDPLFYGFATTLMREFPAARVQVFPAFNSIQMLAHRINLPYQDMVAVSVTGRPWKNLDDALISGYPLIGLLTDRNKTPDAIARRMLEYGYDNYTMTVGEALGNDGQERISHLALSEAAEREFAVPNCVILTQTAPRVRHFGIPENLFTHLDGRAKMITKMPIRLLSLAMLGLPGRRSLWDVGFCTGSVSIEARLQFPHLDVTAFEIRPESERLMQENSRKFGAPGIRAVIGDFLEQDLTAYPRPDAVFIGGHGGRLREMVLRIASVLLPGGFIVFNSVSDDSCRTFREAVAEAGLQIVDSHRMALDDFNPITVLKAQ